MWKLIIVTSLTLCTSVTADEAASKPSVSIEFCGRLRDGIVVIGGECTGTTISFEHIVWEVKLDNDTERKFVQQHNKDTVIVSGSLRKVAGIETKDRWVIDVEKISKRDPTKDKPGIKMSIVGKLQATTTGGPSHMTIASVDQAWPIDLSFNSNLKTTAESFVGQSVMLTGMVKQNDEEEGETTRTQPMLYAQTIKPPPPAADPKH